jgi:hypothetical protein
MKKQQKQAAAASPQSAAEQSPDSTYAFISTQSRPCWKKSDRFERVGNFTLNGSSKQIFPLLCPVLEYAWLPGWSCTMYHSASGVAEKNAIFHTREKLGRKAVWTAITYEPPHFIEYLVVSGKHTVVRLSVGLKEKDAKNTLVDWRMLFTATRALSAYILKKAFSEKNFQKMMNNFEKALNYYLENGEMIKVG